MSIETVEKKLILKVSESSNDVLTNFLKNTDLPLLKKFIQGKLKGNEIYGFEDSPELSDEKIPFKKLNEFIINLDSECTDAKIKKTGYLFGGYYDVKTSLKFAVARDITCCGIVHYLNFHDVYYEYLNKYYISNNLDKVNNINFNVLKAKNFIINRIFCDLFFRSIRKFIPTYYYMSLSLANTLKGIKDALEKSIKSDNFVNTEEEPVLKFKAVVAINPRALEDIQKGIEEKWDDPQIAAYLAFKELPYFKEVSRFKNINSHNYCITFSTIFGRSQILEVINALEKIY